jgi:hypothetical protein
MTPNASQESGSRKGIAPALIVFSAYLVIQAGFFLLDSRGPGNTKPSAACEILDFSSPGNAHVLILELDSRTNLLYFLEASR